MNRKNIYLGMTIVGTLAPPIAGAPYLLEHEYNPAHLMPAIFSTPDLSRTGFRAKETATSILLFLCAPKGIAPLSPYNFMN